MNVQKCLTKRFPSYLKVDLSRRNCFTFSTTICEKRKSIFKWYILEESEQQITWKPLSLVVSTWCPRSRRGDKKSSLFSHLERLVHMKAAKGGSVHILEG